jgi:PAS domain S-box-containing protein
MLQIQQAVLDRINNLIVIINKDCLIDYVSPSVEKSLGYSKEELMGDGWWIKTRDHEHERVIVRAEINELLNSSVESTYLKSERKLKGANGRSRWIEWDISKGPENSIISIGYDITERKNIEFSLLDKNSNLLKIHHELTDSLEYAKNIQQSTLPELGDFKAYFDDVFVYYAPRNIVSGDFYWFKSIENKAYFSVIDCTGHGVPGALMTMIVNSLLKEIIVKRGETNLENILYLLDEELTYQLSGNSSQSLNDGMDLALCSFDKTTRLLNYSGAMRPLWMIRNGELIELKAARYPIGFYHGVEKTFECEEIQLYEGDVIYLFSDGYIDQFGGEKNKKFQKKRFKELLLSIQDLELDEQTGFLEYAINNWRQQNEQTDDIVVIGLRV